MNCLVQVRGKAVAITHLFQSRPVLDAMVWSEVWCVSPTWNIWRTHIYFVKCRGETIQHLLLLRGVDLRGYSRNTSSFSSRKIILYFGKNIIGSSCWSIQCSLCDTSLLLDTKYNNLPRNKHGISEWSHTLSKKALPILNP